MNIFGQFPWSDTTRYNLDWLINKVKELTGKVDKLGDLTVDSYVNASSTNPVENRAIYQFVKSELNNIGSVDGEVF